MYAQFEFVAGGNFGIIEEKMDLKNFISIDWGTSNLRIRVVEMPSLNIIEEVISNHGIKKVYNNWLNSNEERENYFLEILHKELLKLDFPFTNESTILMSGMGSSSIGLRELPYADIPFDRSGSDLSIELINPENKPFAIQLISGVKTSSDVMRGEEVQLIGLLDKEDLKRSVVFILPGTHSKHIYCDSGVVNDFHTFMTGELFDVISKQTILKNSIEKDEMHQSEFKSFEEGVIHANSKNSILNTLFKVRTNSLFKEKTLTENFYFLSGLLIGEELKVLMNSNVDCIKLCAGGELFELYYTAIEALGLISKTGVVAQEIVDAAVIKGQFRILQNKSNW